VTDRPVLGMLCAGTSEVVSTFVAGLQAGHDQRDADILNRQFAGDRVRSPHVLDCASESRDLTSQ